MDVHLFGVESVLGFDPHSITEVAEEFSDFGIPPFAELHSSFGETAVHLLDPGSAVSKLHPTVSRTLRSRLKAVFDERRGKNLSLCTCLGAGGLMGHDLEYQENYSTKHEDFFGLSAKDSVTAKIRMLCPLLKEEVDIYGVVGSGTFGVAFIAREADATKDVEDRKQYAIKGQMHITRVRNMHNRTRYPEMVPFIEPSGEKHYMPEEAVILTYLNHSDRFPTVESVYTHGGQWTVVMLAHVDPTTEGISDIPDIDALGEAGGFIREKTNAVGEVQLEYVLPRFPSFSGAYLMDARYREWVPEDQASKVAGQFQQAMVHLADMGVYHKDISVNNYILDQDLNVQLIDFGQIDFGLTTADFQSNRYRTIPFREYQMTPELAVEMTKYEMAYHSHKDTANLNNRVTNEVYLPHDRRQISLWSYSCIVYGLVHGYWPWDTQEPEEFYWNIKYNGYYTDDCYPVVSARRKRMINEDVSIDESLSQDCQDALQAALARNRADRPSLQEMAAFPWYSQWTATEAESGRPLKRPRIERYVKHQKKNGRKPLRSPFK